MLSEYVVEISTPPAATGVKFDQLMITRPVSGSTSTNSLSAASRGAPVVVETRPFGFGAGPPSDGPCHGLRPSGGRGTPLRCTARAREKLGNRIDGAVNA